MGWPTWPCGSSTSDGITYNFIYFLSWSLVFYLGLTIFSVPYVAMGYEISEDFHERTQIMAVAQFIGQWAWVIAVVLGDPYSSWFPEGADAGVRELPCGWPFVHAVCLIPALFLKSKPTPDRTDFAPINVGAVLSSGEDFRFGVRSVPHQGVSPNRRRDVPHLQLVQRHRGLHVPHHRALHVQQRPASAGTWPAMHGSVGALITTFLVIPVVTWMSKKLGKKKAFMVSQFISIVGYVLFWFLFIPGKLHLFLFALPFHSFGIGSLFTIMMSMTADAR